LEKFQEKLINLDNLTQELNDLVIQGNEETQKRIQSLISLAHSWAEDFSRITKTGG
jgi:hypothetical protein